MPQAPLRCKIVEFICAGKINLMMACKRFGLQQGEEKELRQRKKKMSVSTHVNSNFASNDVCIAFSRSLSDNERSDEADFLPK